MRGIRITAIVFGALSISSALISIVGFITYFYYKTFELSADACGGGPVGMPYILAMLAGGTVGIYAAIIAAICMAVAAGLILIEKVINHKNSKKERS